MLVFLLGALLQQLLLLNQLIVGIIQVMQSLKWARINKFKHRTRLKLTPHIRKKPRPRLLRRRHGPLLEPDFDCYEEAGIYFSDFKSLFADVRLGIERTRNRRIGEGRRTAVSLTSPARLFLVLNFFRMGGKYRRVATRYRVSKSFVSRELRHIVPILYCALSSISWPRTWDHDPFGNVVGAIDCTSHFRTRVHPRQAEFYRGDKHAFFWNCQVVVSLDGHFINVCLVPGHNNDSGTFKLTGMDMDLAKEDLLLLADAGYSHHRLVTPDHTKSIVHNSFLSFFC
jgi:hypothetical protein